jgi:hypothetical protein
LKAQNQYKTCNDSFTSELQIENKIFESYNELNKCIITGKTYNRYERQFNLKPYGIADIVGYSFNKHDKSFVIDIIEIKKGFVNAKAIVQILRYKQAFIDLLTSYGDIKYDIKCYLVGTLYRRLHDVDLLIDSMEGVTSHVLCGSVEKINIIECSPSFVRVSPPSTRQAYNLISGVIS